MSKYRYFWEGCCDVLRRFDENLACEAILPLVDGDKWETVDDMIEGCINVGDEELTEDEVRSRFPQVPLDEDISEPQNDWIEQAAEEICDIDIEDGSFMPPRIAEIIRKHFEGRVK